MTAPAHRSPTAFSASAQAPSTSSPWPWWLITIVILGALLTATGAIAALVAPGEHLNSAGSSYAHYFVTRNLSLALLLLLMLAARAPRALATLMLLTALIQTLDAITATATAHYGLVPIDLTFAALFLTGANRLSPQPLWRTTASRDQRVHLPDSSRTNADGG